MCLFFSSMYTQIGAFNILQFSIKLLHNCTVALLNYPLSCCEVKALFNKEKTENGRTSDTSLQALVQCGNLRNVTYFLKSV